MKNFNYELLELPVIYYQEESFETVNPQGELVRDIKVHRIVTRGTIDPGSIDAVTGSAGYSEKEKAIKMSCSRLWLKSGHAMEIDLPESETRTRWINSKLHNDKITLIFKMT